MTKRYLVTFSILALSVLLGAMDTAPAHTCPPPTVSSGAHCVLQHDVILTATLDLGSFAHLNCQGNTITPSVVGTGTDIAQRSQPEVAILLTGAYGGRTPQTQAIATSSIGISRSKTITGRSCSDALTKVTKLSPHFVDPVRIDALIY